MMKNKNMYKTRFLCLIPITLFLLYFFLKTPNGKLFLIPFLICSFAMLLKNVFLFFDEQRYSKQFDIIFRLSFFLFWFGFLSYWCYLSFIQKTYSLLFFSIPFWIAGIVVLKKSFWKTKPNALLANITAKFNFKVILSSSLVLLTFLIGFFLLFFGIRDTFQVHEKTKNYLTTTGYLKDSISDTNAKNEVTYQLIYQYEVNGKFYDIKTDYSTNYISTQNSMREVKFNPNNPEEAILVGTNSSTFLIFIGAFFLLGSTAFILLAFTVLGYLDRFQLDIMGIYIGFIFLIVGIGIILFQNGITMSFLETIKSLGLWSLIPFSFIGVGIFQIVKCLFQKKHSL